MFMRLLAFLPLRCQLGSNRIKLLLEQNKNKRGEKNKKIKIKMGRLKKKKRWFRSVCF